MDGNATSSRPIGSPTLTMRIYGRPTPQCRVEFSGPHTAVLEFPFVSPVLDHDAEDFRWLVEDYLRLLGPTSDAVARRVSTRVAELATELSAAVFEADPRMAPVRELLTQRDLVDDLAVRIQGGPHDPWIPWEIIPGPGDPVALSRRAASFVRTGPEPLPTDNEATERAITAGGLRVLVVVSRPAGIGDVPFRSVASRIVRAAGLPGSAVDVRLLRPPTWAGFERELTAAQEAGRPYDVVHFDGHGVYRPDAFVPSRKRGYICFESDEPGVVEVHGRRVGALLAQCGVPVAIVNACRSAYSEDGGETLADHGMARSFVGDLLSAGVREAMAMAFNVYVSTAARFIAEVYEGLAAGRTLATATRDARRREAGQASNPVTQPWGWAIPILYHGTHAPAAREAEPPARGSDVQRVDAADSRRSADNYVGYDKEFLLLDRAVATAGQGRIAGLASSGKSAFAHEFAAWAAATGLTDAAILTDVAPSLEASSLYSRVETLLPRRPSNGEQRVLLVVDGIDDERSDALASRVADELGNRLSTRRTSVRLLRVGRLATQSSEVDTVILNGLDPDAMRELAAVSGWTATSVPTPAAWMDWSHGLPGLVKAVPRIVDSLCGPNAGEEDNRLQELRGGLPEPAVAASLLESQGVDLLDPDGMTSVTMPIAASLFQARVTAPEWEVFRQIQADRGLVALADHLGDLFTSRVGAAASAGFAIRLPDGSAALHPLAPTAVRHAYEVTLDFLGHGNPAEKAQHLINQLGAYVMAVSAITRARKYTAWRSTIASALESRENILCALDLAIKLNAWEHAFPLMRMLRDDLLDERRVEEWEAQFSRAEAAFRRAPSRAVAEWQLEDPKVLYARLQADEAKRHRDFDSAKRWHYEALELTLLAAKKTYADPNRATVAVNRLYTAFIREGDELRDADSTECLDWYTMALELVPDDTDRAVSAQLAIARAYFNVSGLLDIGKYERCARDALAAAQSLGALGRETVSECWLSVGTAIWESCRMADVPDRARIEEAMSYFVRVINSGHGNLETVTAANNNAGVVLLASNSQDFGVSYLLKACAGYERLARWELLVLARANAALALRAFGRLVDARDVAQQAMDLELVAPKQVAKVAPMLFDLLA